MAYYAYVIVAGENKILTYSLDPSSGKLDLLREMVLEGGPSNLAVSPDQQFMYVGLRANPGLATLRIDHGSGDLALQGEPVSLEEDPCCIAVDRTGRFVFSAHYQGRRIGVHPIGEDRRVTGPPVEWIETLVGAHCVQAHPSNRFVFLPHVDQSNAIFQFLFDEKTGKLTPNAVPRVDGYEGQGPRHYCYHPNLDVLYTSNEQASAITAYNLDVSAGTIESFQTVSTLPDGYSDTNSNAQIRITSSGKFVYVSNRGHDSIAGFAIDQKTGGVTALGQTPSEPTPRVFNIDPTDSFLYAAGQGSNTLASYRIGDDGGLSALETYPLGDNPMWVQILDL
jgi:6-phosphogluconolactonase